MTYFLVLDRLAQVGGGLDTILVVEDSHDIRVSLRELLEQEGYIVYTAAEGRAALALLARIQCPIVILLDQNMPIMDGEAFLEEKQKDERIAGIPVIVLSAVSDRSTRLGASEFMSKPFDAGRLLVAIRKYRSTSSDSNGMTGSGVS